MPLEPLALMPLAALLSMVPGASGGRGDYKAEFGMERDDRCFVDREMPDAVTTE
jgi:hypothetical protein